MTQTASGTVADRGSRAQVALGSLGWAYLASIHTGDLIRANLLLLAFQRAWNAYGYFVTAAQPQRIQDALRLIPINGQWSCYAGLVGCVGPTSVTATANAVALAAVPAEEVNTRTELVHTSSPAGGGVPAAGAYFGNRLLYLAPMGDERIWMVYHWAQEVAPQDVQSHLEQRLFDYIEGGDEDPTDQAVPLDAQRAGVPAPTPPRVYNIPTPIHVPGIVPRGGKLAFWPWAVAGVGLVVLTGVLLFRRGKRRGR
jgi:hypothetical protein